MGVDGQANSKERPPLRGHGIVGHRQRSPTLPKDWGVASNLRDSTQDRAQRVQKHVQHNGGATRHTRHHTTAQVTRHENAQLTGLPGKRMTPMGRRGKGMEEVWCTHRGTAKSVAPLTTVCVGCGAGEGVCHASIYPCTDTSEAPCHQCALGFQPIDGNKPLQRRTHTHLQDGNVVEVVRGVGRGPHLELSQLQACVNHGGLCVSCVHLCRTTVHNHTHTHTPPG